MVIQMLLLLSLGVWVRSIWLEYKKSRKQSRVWSVPTIRSANERDETPVLRYHKGDACIHEECSVPLNTFRTLNDSLRYAVSQWPKKSTLGMRRLQRMVVEKVPDAYASPKAIEAAKQTRKFACYGKYKWITYEEMWEEQGLIGRGLRRMGVEPKDSFGVWAPTSRQCTMFICGSMRQNITVVTVYNTLGKSGLCQALKETNAQGLLVRVDQLPQIDDLAECLPNLKLIVYFGQGEWDCECAMQSQHAVERLSKRIAVLSLTELINVGRQHSIDDTEPEPNSIVCVMYTSGSTGKPKGVVLTHSNLLSSLSAITTTILSYKIESDVYLSYLPTSHILEFIIQLGDLTCGVCIGYGTPHSLTDAMVRDCRGDLVELQPTLMAGVPHVWDTIRREIIYQVRRRGRRVEKVFDILVSLKWYLMNNSLPHSWLDWLAFNKVKRVLGGRLRYTLSGGASISAETQKFLSTVLCPLLQGYGMTESSGVIAIQTPDNFCIKHTGSVVPNMDIKLVSVPEAGYLACNNVGEIWVRGPAVTFGYLNSENSCITAPATMPDGWYRTGDIAQWHPNGQIEIIDRIKNIQKLANGEYVALEKLEAVYKTSVYVANVCVDVQPDQRQPMAVVSPDPKTVAQLGESLGYSPNSKIHDLCKEPKIQEHIFDSLLAAAAANGFVRTETVIGCVIDPDGWTPENGFLTAATKLQRARIRQKLAQQIDEVYLKYRLSV